MFVVDVFVILGWRTLGNGLKLPVEIRDLIIPHVKSYLFYT